MTFRIEVYFSVNLALGLRDLMAPGQKISQNYGCFVK